MFVLLYAREGGENEHNKGFELNLPHLSPAPYFWTIETNKSYSSADHSPIDCETLFESKFSKGASCHYKSWLCLPRSIVAIEVSVWIFVQQSGSTKNTILAWCASQLNDISLPILRADTHCASLLLLFVVYHRVSHCNIYISLFPVLPSLAFRSSSEAGMLYFFTYSVLTQPVKCPSTVILGFLFFFSQYSAGAMSVWKSGWKRIRPRSTRITKWNYLMSLRLLFLGCSFSINLSCKLLGLNLVFLLDSFRMIWG